MAASSAANGPETDGYALVGRILRLQIQYWEMTGKGGYDTGALAPADQLLLTPDGPYGLVENAWIMDRHHRHHPASRHWHAEDVLSFGFSAHYDHMSETFRPIPLGIAGENIIIETESMIGIEDIEGGMRIQTGTGTIDMVDPAVAEPCVEFTRFLTERPDADAYEMKPWREKLKHGVRGFVVGITANSPFAVNVGDLVLAKKAA